MTLPEPEPALGAAAPMRPGRLVHPAPGEVRPLYSVGRLLHGEIFEAERILRDAEALQREMEAQAGALLEAARQEAERIVGAAREQADQVRAQARDRGRDEARRDVQALLCGVEAQVEELRGRYPADVQRMAYRYAHKVLDVELAVRPERIVDLVRKVLERARQYRQIRIRLHPEDLPHVSAALEELKRQLVFASDVRVVEDRELARHGVRIETEMGTYLGSVEEQLRPLGDALGLGELAPPEPLDDEDPGMPLHDEDPGASLHGGDPGAPLHGGDPGAPLHAEDSGPPRHGGDAGAPLDGEEPRRG